MSFLVKPKSILWLFSAPPLKKRILILQPALSDNLTAITVSATTPWLPASVRAAVKKGKPLTLRGSLSRTERRVLRKKKPIAPSDHAARYRHMAAGEAHPGKWNNDFTPHAVKIMDTFGQPWVREIWFCGVEQAGKTNTMLNCISWIKDRKRGNIFYLMPTEDASEKIIGKKLIPMFKESPQLAQYLTGKYVDIGKKIINFNDGTALFPAHSNSAQSMATFSAPYCFGDEIDKYPLLVGKETDPITLIKKRARAFRFSKFFFASTPAGKFIYKGMQGCHQVWARRLLCPHCGDYISMEAKRLVIPEDITPENIELRSKDIGYACTSCSTIWDESTRQMAIRQAVWVCLRGQEISKPAKVGFHLRAWECADISLVEIAGQWLKRKRGDLGADIGWDNGIEAKDYQPETSTGETSAILALCDDRPRDAVRTDTAALLMQVDTQQDGFYYEIAGVQFGRSLTTYQVREGYVQNFSDLVEIADLDFEDATGKKYKPYSGVIDSGGGRKGGAQHSRTHEVYQFCKDHPFFKPLKGVDRSTSPWRISNLDRWPGTNKPIRGGLVLYNINVNYYKDALAGKLQVAIDDPGAWIFYSGYTAEELQRLEKDPSVKLLNRMDEVARHYCSEYRDETGQWHHDRGKGRNDYFDVGVYRLFHCDLLRVAEWVQQDEQDQAEKEKQRKQKPLKKKFVSGSQY